MNDSSTTHFENLLNGRNLVVWGTGNDAKVIFQHYPSFEKIEFFISKDFQRNTSFFGKPVYGKEALIKGKHFVVIATSLFYKEVLKELNELEFSEEDYCLVSPVYLQYCSTMYFFQSPWKANTFTHVGKYSFFSKAFLRSKSIGNFVSINLSALNGGEHIKGITLSHFLHDTGISTKNKFLNDFFNKNNIFHSLTIGNDVYIGANTFINLSKVKNIGNGAIIGTGAVVLHDVPPYAIMVGCPARILRYRFSPKEIECLERVKWWNWSNDELEKNSDLLYSHELFFDKFM